MRARILKATWLLLAVPGLVHLALMVVAIAQRFFYPYDLEWMEGGLLTHALRLSRGEPIYAPPSVEFISYLYTPLYPALLAALGKVTEIGYVLGRAVSVLSLMVTCVILVASVVGTAPREHRTERGAAITGAACGLGFFAATYPWVDGWYDLVRADMLFLALGISGLAMLRAATGRAGVALAGLFLGLSFFAKQTGVPLVLAGGLALLVMNWRVLPIFAVVTGAIGGGGTLLLNRVTGGWFWTYVFAYHQQHDTNRDRFFLSFKNILLHFPAMTFVIALTLVVALVSGAVSRSLPSAAKTFLFWTWMFACGVLIGAVGWATQWAHFNAYIPAMALGALAAGHAIPALVSLFRDKWPRIGMAVALACGATLAFQLAWVRWDPRPLIPTAKDRTAGDKLIARLRAIDGDVFFPFHPFYPHLAGKRTFAHRMGILDVTYLPPPSSNKRPLPEAARKVAGLAEALRSQRFAAIVLDDRAQLYELPGLTEAYRQVDTLGWDESPRVVSGARTMPRTIWQPKSRSAP
ncbi:MAG: hypothetical protein HY698_06220 [Deltaproteobacteria bacterium]|nr:hypothetical protein [Deltaproteobacteria bacterium]